MAEPIRIVPAGSRAARTAARPWVQWFARFGFASKGIVYMLIGAIAVQSAFGDGSATSSTGALETMIGKPFGRIMLVIMAAGLGCYALWRSYAALANPEADSVGKRVHHAWIAAIHVGLSVAAARLAMSGVRSGKGEDADTIGWTGRVLDQPFGRWLVLAGGLMVGGYALYQFYRAATADLDDQLDLSDVQHGRRELLRRVSRAGIAARGVVFAIISVYVIRAAWKYDASQARGIGGALRELGEAPYGPLLLGIVAAGLMAYGVYGLIRARYRVVRSG